MTAPSAPYLPHRHSIDNPYTRAPASGSPVAAAQPPTPTPIHRSSTRYGYEDRRTSLDGSRATKSHLATAASRPSPSPPQSASASSRNSSSGIFARKLLKKNRSHSSSSSASSQSASLASPLPSPKLPATSQPPLSPPGAVPPYPRYPHAASMRPVYPSPYPPYQTAPLPPPGAAPSPGHRLGSMTSTHPPSHSPAIQETEEEQLARIKRESLEYEQQRVMNLADEEERRLQRALAESCALAELERVRADERERIRTREEEIAVREALVYSREFEQVENERLAREARRRTLEEEKEVQRVLARSRTVDSRRNDPEHDDGSRFVTDTVARMDMNDDQGGRRESQGAEEARLRDVEDWNRRHFEAASHGTTVGSSPSSHLPGALRPLPDQTRPGIPTLQSSFVVANPDQSSSSFDGSDDEDGPPPSYSLMAQESDRPRNPTSTSLVGPREPRTLSAVTAVEPVLPPRLPHSDDLSQRPLPETIDHQLSTAGTPYSEPFERADSTVASVGAYHPIASASPSLSEPVRTEYSVVEERDSLDPSENPFDDQFASTYDDDEEDAPTDSMPHREDSQGSVASQPDMQTEVDELVQPPIVIETAPSPSSNTDSVPANLFNLPSSLPLDSLGVHSTTPAPIRRVSEPPPTVPTLLHSPGLPLASSHSANNTPEPSPGLAVYPDSPSFGGIVEDHAPSTLAAAQYVLEGVSWGFVSIERAAMHPPLDSKGAFPRGAQLSSSKNEEGKQAFVSFAIEAKSWDSLLVYLTWFGKSRFEASPHDHGVDETGQGHQVSIRIEFFRSFLDSSCRVRCRLELLPLSQSRPLSSETISPNASIAETTPSFDNDCPTVHILLSNRPHLPLSLSNLASLLVNSLAHSRRQHSPASSHSSSTQHGFTSKQQQQQQPQGGCLSEAVDFLRRLNGEDRNGNAGYYHDNNDNDDGNDSDEIGWTDKLKSRLRKRKVRVIKTSSTESSSAKGSNDRRSVLPEGAMMISPFSIE